MKTGTCPITPRDVIVVGATEKHPTDVCTYVVPLDGTFLLLPSHILRAAKFLIQFTTFFRVFDFFSFSTERGVLLGQLLTRKINQKRKRKGTSFFADHGAIYHPFLPAPVAFSVALSLSDLGWHKSITVTYFFCFVFFVCFIFLQGTAWIKNNNSIKKQHIWKLPWLPGPYLFIIHGLAQKTIWYVTLEILSCSCPYSMGNTYTPITHYWTVPLRN